MRSLFCTNSKYYNNYYVNKEIYDRILKIKNLINYHATKKITDYNFNSINNINNNNFIHNRIELKRKYREICLLSYKIKIKDNSLFTYEQFNNYANIITDMENLLLDMDLYYEL
jgi:hypothetical protein